MEEAMKQLYLHFTRMSNPEFFGKGRRRRYVDHAVFAAQQEKRGHSELGMQLMQGSEPLLDSEVCRRRYPFVHEGIVQVTIHLILIVAEVASLNAIGHLQGGEERRNLPCHLGFQQL